MIFNVTGGGGAALNFKVVGYATKEELLAATPAENTIGIITEIPITGYHFGTEEPSPAAAGMVWITTGTSSAIEFNALKKNAIQVYPLSAKQQDGSAWVDVTALSYQGGEWVEWWDGTLYDAGDQQEAYTGGWTGWAWRGNSLGTITLGSDRFTITVAGNSVAATPANKIDVTDYTILRVRKLTGSNSANDRLFFGLRSHKSKDGTYPEAYVDIGQKAAGTYELDIANLTGEYYVGAFCWAVSGATYTLSFDFVKLE